MKDLYHIKNIRANIPLLSENENKKYIAINSHPQVTQARHTRVFELWYYYKNVGVITIFKPILQISFSKRNYCQLVAILYNRF